MYGPGMPGMPGPGMPGGFAPYGPPPGFPTGSLPGAVNVSGRPSTDPLRRQCEGNGGFFQDIRPPALSMLPGMQIDIPVQATCQLPGGSSTYDRGSWTPPLTSLSGCGCGLGAEPEALNWTHLLGLTIAIAGFIWVWRRSR